MFYEGQFLLDLEWGENNSEGGDKMSENDNDANGKRYASSETRGNNEGESTNNIGVSANDKRENDSGANGWINRGSEEDESSETQCYEYKGESSIARGYKSERIANVFNEDAERVYKQRVWRPPSYLSDYIISIDGDYVLFIDELNEDETHIIQNVSIGDPLYFEQEVKDEKWRQAMDCKNNSINNNKTWYLSELPTGAKNIDIKWVYKTKYNKHGEIDKHKTRLIAKDYS